MNVLQKFEIFADVAKYDVCCASSGSERKKLISSKGIGFAEHLKSPQHNQMTLNVGVIVLGGCWLIK